MKSKLIAASAAAIVIGSAYAYWQNENTPLPVVNQTVQSSKTAGSLPVNQNPQDAAGTHVVAGAGKLKSPNPPSDSLPVPAPVDESAQNRPSNVRLWQAVEGDSATTIDGMPATRLQVNPKRLDQLHVGQTLTLDIPQEGTAFEAKITSTHNDPTGVKVWRADIADALDAAGVIITQGKIQTHLVIASEQGNYSVVIDNKTGESTLIDESEINAGMAPFDDGIAVGPPEESTLPPIN